MIGSNNDISFTSLSRSKIPDKFESLINTPITEYDFSPIGTIEGIYFIPDYTSGNKVHYSVDFWRKVLSNPDLKSRMDLGTMVGIFEHPYIRKMETADGKMTLRHPMHGGLITKKLWIEELPSIVDYGNGNKSKYVGKGKSYILNTPMGRLIAMYLSMKDEDGNQLVKTSISSRGYGGTGPKRNGIEIAEPSTYYLDAFDITLYPGVVDTNVSFETFKSNISGKSKSESCLPILNGLSSSVATKMKYESTDSSNTNLDLQVRSLMDKCDGLCYAKTILANELSLVSKLGRSRH